MEDLDLTVGAAQKAMARQTLLQGQLSCAEVILVMRQPARAGQRFCPRCQVDVVGRLGASKQAAQPAATFFPVTPAQPEAPQGGGHAQSLFDILSLLGPYQ